AQQCPHFLERPRVDYAPLRLSARSALASQAGNVHHRLCSHRFALAKLQRFIAASMVLPSAAGEFATRMPALFMASILATAVPLPPEMISPACPMRRPGAAVVAAMKPTTGLRVRASFRNSAPSASAPPP